jgi:hypothetical protein
MKSTKFKTYHIIKKAVSKELAEFLKDYLILKSQVHNYYKEKRIISPLNILFGETEDVQVPGSYCCYGDTAMDNLLVKLKSKVEKCVGKKLIETYSYSRVYVKGAELKRHKDRFSCELSTTLNLGGDPWPIYVDETPDNLDKHIQNNPYFSPFNKGTKINLSPGDMMVYEGCNVEHWREKFKGKQCVQTFLHYNFYSKENLIRKWDGRKQLGSSSKMKLF